MNQLSNKIERMQKQVQPIEVEVEKTVRDTINVELQRLRQKMNNQVSEQVVQLKGQLLKAKENRHYNKDQKKNQDKLPESVKFTFPRPYYNLADPYLGTNDEANKDLNQIFNDLVKIKESQKSNQIRLFLS